MFRPRFLAVVAALAVPVTAIAATVDTAAGPVDIARADRVAVMDVAAIDTLAALGVTAAGVPDRLYVDYLDDATRDAAPIGTLFEPDLEKLAALGPDLIVAGGRSVAQAEAMAQVAPVIDMTIGSDVLADTRARLAAYGALFGRQDRAAELDAALDADLAALAQAGRGRGKALIVLTNGSKMSAFGRGSRFGWILDATGLAEAAPGLKIDTHGASISHEFIARANPDWLFVIDRGAAVGQDGPTARATLDTPLVAGTSAWRNGNVVYLDPTSLYIASGGYTATTRTIRDLTQALAR